MKRRPRMGKVKRDSGHIGFHKLLTETEQRQLADYLAGRQRSVINKKFVNPNSVKGCRNLLIYELMLSTGLRAEELCNLQVRHTPEVLGVNSIEVYKGKNDKDRTVPVSADMAQALAVYVNKYRAKMLPRHIRKSDTVRPVFYSQKRKPLSTSGLYRLFRNAGKQAAIKKNVHPHMFRHSFAVNTLTRGVDIYMLKHLMGHSNISITQKYLHITNEQIEGLGEKLSTRF